jgi:hypothetical protein
LGIKKGSFISFEKEESSEDEVKPSTPLTKETKNDFHIDFQVTDACEHE